MVLIGNLGVIPATVALFVLIAWRQRMTFLWPLTSALIVMLLFLHWGTDPILREPLGQSAFRLALGRHFSTNVLNISAMPVFLSAWRQQFAAHAPLFLAEYILILLPVGWLFGAQKSSSTAGATLRDH